MCVSALALLTSACGGNKNSATSDSDSILTDSIAVETYQESDAQWLISADSVYSATGESLLTGTELDKLPESIAGLYDKIEKTTGMDALEINFINGTENVMTGLDFGEGKIDLLVVTSDRIKVATPQEGVIGLGSQFEEVTALPGVKAEWSGYDGEGAWYWTWHGLWFAPAQEGLTEKLSRKLYNSESTFTADDFKDATIGYMATGLPF